MTPKRVDDTLRRRVGPEDEDRKTPDDAAIVPTLAERTTDLGITTESERKADMMRQEVDEPADDPGRGLQRRERHPGREDAGH